MSDIVKEVSEYYTGKVKQFGNDSRGVDWNTKESQYLRFEKLAELIKSVEIFSVLDFGCGTGELVNFLDQKKMSFNYLGFDISEEMLRIANENHKKDNVIFSSEDPKGSWDYVVGSGIFNVKMNFSENDWKQYIHHTLEKFNNISTKGFAFNALSLYSDADKRRSDLFYADPLYYFDFCKKNYSRYVTLLHDYPLYEFTLLVRKDV